MKTCTIDWCENKLLCKWYCNKHYQKYKTYWNPLIYFRIPKWEGMQDHVLYYRYKEIKQRCYNTKNKHYKDYWWRGIIVCDRRLWVDWFKNFISDMWYYQEWYSIDRIDNDWPYSPDNCRRANNHQQQANRRGSNKVVWVWRCGYYNKRKARITINKKDICLWYYHIYEDAVKARKESEIKYSIYTN